MINPFGECLNSSSSIDEASATSRAGLALQNKSLGHLSQAVCYNYELLFQACRRPVFQLHAQGQAARCQHFLDFVQGLAAQIWRFQQFVFRTLDQVADVVDVFRFQAVRRTHGQLQIVDWTQQDRIDQRSARWRFGGGFRAFQGGEYIQLVHQDAGRLADRFFRRDHAVGFDVDDQLVQVGTLFNASRFNEVRYAAHWRERCIQNDAADGLVRVFRQATHVTRNVAAAFFNLDLHVQLATSGQVGDHVVRVDQFDVMRQVDVGGQDRAFAFFFQGQGYRIAVVDFENHTLQVQQQIDDVFLHAIEGGIFVDDAGDRHFGRRVAYHRRQQNAAQRVTQCVAIAALERFHHYFDVTSTESFNIDNTWLQQTVLHEMSFSIPSAHYTDKADGISETPTLQKQSGRRSCY